MGISDDILTKIIVEGDFIDKKSIDKIIENAKVKNVSLYGAILDSDKISDENLGKLIADYYKIQSVDLKQTIIDERILKIIPEQSAKLWRAICFYSDDKEVRIAVSDPQIPDLIEMLKKKTKKQVVIYYATERGIDAAISLYKKKLQMAFEDILKEEIARAGKNNQDDAPIVKIVDMLIEYGCDNKASDIHIEPKKTETIVRFRIDGILHDVLNLPIALHSQILSRIKVKSKLRTDEHLAAQDGKMMVTVNSEDIDIRISIIPIVHGEDCVMRLLTAKNRSFSFADLGMSKDDNEKVNKAYKKPFGMILSTGPTGSGKTTTMYAILKKLNTRERNIATIEDPVEYDIEGISQIQVNVKTNLTFADGLRSILRQDPDIIFIGEIRDRETVGIAINSALTGHLVLSTLHTNDAASSLLRMVDMGVEPFLIASSVNIIVAQRLVRTICDKCKVSVQKTEEEMSQHFDTKLISKFFKTKKEMRVYYGKGCPTCHMTGYIGRVGLFEVLEMTEKIKEMVVKKANSDDIVIQAKKDGMTLMVEDGLDKIQRGITSIEEVLRVTNN